MTQLAWERSEICTNGGIRCDVGPGFGYFPNAAKTWLVTKEAYHSEAVTTFEGTDVRITSECRPH